MWEYRIKQNDRLYIFNPSTRQELLFPKSIPIIVNDKRFKVDVKNTLLGPTLDRVKQEGIPFIPEQTFQIFRLCADIIDFFKTLVAVYDSDQFFRQRIKISINGIEGKTLWINSIRDFVNKYKDSHMNDRYPDIFKWFEEIIYAVDNKKTINYQTDLIKNIIQDSYLLSLIADVSKNYHKFDYLNRFIAVDYNKDSLEKRLTPFLNKQLLLSDPEHFNDPFDYKRPLFPEELHKVLSEKGISSIDERNKLLAKCKANLAFLEKSKAVCSFSLVNPLRITKNKLLTNASSAMWGHYANIGHGFVISYSLLNLMQEINRLSNSGLLSSEVIYDDAYLYEYIALVKEYYNLASDFYIHKNKNLAADIAFNNFISNKDLQKLNKQFYINLIMKKDTQWAGEWEFRISKNIDNIFQNTQLPVEKTIIYNGISYDLTHQDEQLKFINSARRDFFNVADRFHCHDDFLFPDRIIIGWKMNDEKSEHIVNKVKECNKKNNLKIEVIKILSDNNGQPYFTSQGFYKTKHIL